MANAGMDTYEAPAGGLGAAASGRPTSTSTSTGAGSDTGTLAASSTDTLLAGVRRLMRLADSASDAQEIFPALAAELFAELACEEVQVHRLCEGEDQVAVYMFGGEGRLSYQTPHAERPPGVSWVASTGQSVVVSGARELAASVPRLAVSGGVGGALLLGLAVRGEVEAVCILTRAGTEPFDGHSVQRAATLVDQAATALALLRARAEAGTDPVTDCMNHRAMRRRLDEEIARATRTGGRLSCLLIDLDNFKQVNDRHGHSAGDALLRGVAHALMGEFRAFDRVARYGGDEFVVILADADLERAAIAAERARERMLGVASFGVVPGVSASIGVAQWREPMSTDELLDACDAALLHGKRNGKGNVTRAA